MAPTRSPTAETMRPALPSGACDCHMHVFGDPQDYPGSADRTYQPTEMPVGAYLAMAESLGLERRVLVQPSAYGADNSCMLGVLGEMPANIRGVAVLHDDADDERIGTLDQWGVRGHRLNLMTPRLSDPELACARLDKAARRVQRVGWHVQIYADSALVAAVAPAVRRSPVPVVFDHMGGVTQEMAPDAPDFVTLLDVVSEGKAWVKLSGADIVTWRNEDFDGAAAFADALLSANRDRIVWGTDWPHLVHHASGQGDAAPMAGYRPVHEQALLDFLRERAGDMETLQRILVDNPTRLYRF